MSNVEHPDSNTMGYGVDGGIYAEDGAYGEFLLNMVGSSVNGELQVKAYDYSVTGLPVWNKWVLAYMGEVVNYEMMQAASSLALTVNLDTGEGGTVIPNKENFYLAFEVADGEAREHLWYGWLNLSIDETLHMSLLGADVGLYGEAVTVGVTTPEPTAALLLLLGAGALCLRRRSPAA